MKLPTFYLSTLLMLSIFGGAVLGLWVTRNAWHLERIVDEKSFGTGLARSLDDFSQNVKFEAPSTDNLLSSSAYTTDKSESAEVGDDGKTIKVKGKDASGQYSVQKATIDTGRKIVWLQYSKDGLRIGAMCEDAVAIYHRNRSYGWLGLFQLPLTWLAIGALVGLIAIFARGLMRKPAARAA
jgi:hypothetical protein